MDTRTDVSPDASSTVVAAADPPNPASPLSPLSPVDFYDAEQSLESPGRALPADAADKPPFLPPSREAERQDRLPGKEDTQSTDDASMAGAAQPTGMHLEQPGSHPGHSTSNRQAASVTSVPKSPAEQESTSPQESASVPMTTLQSTSPEATVKAEKLPAYPSGISSQPDDPEKIEALPAHLQPASSEASADDIEKEKAKRPSLGRRQTTRDDTKPPSLHYTLRTRKLYITIFWSLILIDSIAIPLVLYFCLHYLTSLSPNAVFSISTACLGGISILEYILRFWRLWNKNSKCRVIGGKRWYLDWFHFNFTAAWIFIMAELIVGTSPDDPPIRLLAMPLSSLCFFFCLSLITQDILRVLKVPQPFRISSLPRGSQFRPGVYHIIEDICAVDGSGGTIFRRRLNARWNASHEFRQMIHRLTLVWSFVMLAFAIATTVLVFALNNGEIAYIVGWVAPFIGAGFLTLWTFWYVKRCLKSEYANWPQTRGQV